MVTVWWYNGGIIHQSFLKTGETITAEKYCQELDTMNEKLKLLRPALVNRKKVILLHDNARPHFSKVSLEKIRQLDYEILPHPAFSPGISPTEYHLFKHPDAFLAQKNFSKQTDVETAFKEFIDSRDADFYRYGIYKFPIRWQKCVDCYGSYFE